MKLSDIFEEKPKTWGFRGDPYFWDYLKEKAENMDIISADELEKWIKKEHFFVSGKELTYNSIAVVEQFAHGGMSSGGIAGDWWTETGIPLLKSRLDTLIPELKIFETELNDDVFFELRIMSRQWAAENSCHGYRANERSDIEGNRIFLAQLGEEVVGYLFGKICKSEKSSSIMPDGTPYFEVEELFVRLEYRGRGIGKKLFSFVERSVSDSAEYMMLSTATKNWRAILHLYIDELDMSFWNARLYKKI